jgi:hypothetical protein
MDDFRDSKLKTKTQSKHLKVNKSALVSAYLVDNQSQGPALISSEATHQSQEIPRDKYLRSIKH